ncbi:Protein of unknown function DUF1637 domain containing protein [Aphelenchoides besseyi]|nr:Protein of unknown function DUF1637 domain containing protein [Aphelenchoides besseyi]
MADRSAFRQILRTVESIAQKGGYPPRFDSNTIEELRNLVSKVSASVLEINLPPIDNSPVSSYDNIYCTDVHTNSILSSGVFGMKRAGGRIPMHDHQMIFGFIRVLRGQICIRSYSWMADEELNFQSRHRLSSTKPSEELRPVIFEGEQIFGVGQSGNPQSVAYLSPTFGNVHEIFAVEDGSAFFDLLIPGYNDVTDCHYYTRLHEHEGGDTQLQTGQKCWLRQTSCPRDYYTTDLLSYPTIKHL